jgi:hypothetical protein
MSEALAGAAYVFARVVQGGLIATALPLSVVPFLTTKLYPLTPIATLLFALVMLVFVLVVETVAIPPLREWSG